MVRRSLRIFVIVALALTSVFVARLASAQETPKKNSSASPSKLVGAGVGAFVVGYGYAATMGGLVYRTPGGNVPSAMFLPVAGPYLALAEGQIPVKTLIGVRAGDAYVRNQHGAATFEDVSVFMGALVLVGFEYTFLVLDPIVQGTGIAAITIGATRAASSDAKTKSNSKATNISFAPTWNAGPGVSMLVSSW